MKKLTGILILMIGIQSLQPIEAASGQKTAGICLASMLVLTCAIGLPIKSCQVDRNKVLGPRETQLLGTSLLSGEFKELQSSKTYFVEKTRESTAVNFIVVSKAYDLQNLSYPEDTIKYGSIIGSTGLRSEDIKLQYLDSQQKLVFQLGDLARSGDLQVFDSMGKLQYEIPVSSWGNVNMAEEFTFKNRDGYVIAVAKAPRQSDLISIFSESGDLLATIKRTELRKWIYSYRVDVFDPSRLSPEVIMSLIVIKD